MTLDMVWIHGPTGLAYIVIGGGLLHSTFRPSVISPTQTIRLVTALFVLVCGLHHINQVVTLPELWELGVDLYMVFVSVLSMALYVRSGLESRRE